MCCVQLLLLNRNFKKHSCNQDVSTLKSNTNEYILKKTQVKPAPVPCFDKIRRRTLPPVSNNEAARLKILRLKSARRKKEVEERRVQPMLPVSVNTRSHLQSAETLVCLHCLAEPPHKHTHTHFKTEGEDPLSHAATHRYSTLHIRLQVL